MKLTPAASTATSTSPAPGCGASRAPSRSTSVPPGRCARIARMAPTLRRASRDVSRSARDAACRAARRTVGGAPARRRRTMAVPYDTSDPKFAEYAHPGRLVSTQWLAEHLGTPGLVVVESDEDVLLYETGHIPGAVKVDWHTELNDPVVRDYLDGEGFAALMRAKGIAREDTVVIYGDKNNWWAAYAAWVFSLFGHEDVRLLDGGRNRWVAEGRDLTTETVSRPATDYPVVERDDTTLRAFKDDVLAHLRAGTPLVDIRSAGEYSGELQHMPDYPQEGALRTGHIPTARNVPWATAVAEDGTYRPR